MNRKPIRLDGNDLALIVAALRDGARIHHRRRQTASRMSELATLVEDAELILVPPILPLLLVLARARRPS